MEQIPNGCIYTNGSIRIYQSTINYTQQLKSKFCISNNLRIKWVIGASLESIITLIFSCNWIWNVIQDVNNLFLIEGAIFTVEVNGHGYTFIFYFLLATPSELKTSLSTKDDKIQLLEPWRCL